MNYVELLALSNNQQKQIAKLKEECADYINILRYCKHNKAGQGVRINGVLWKWSDDV
jgi:hypothetical protein